MNRFLYAEGNPATLIDPDGHGVDCGLGEVCTAEEKAADLQRLQDYYQATKQTYVPASDERPRFVSGPAHVAEGFVPRADYFSARDLLPKMGGGCASASVSLPVVIGGQACLLGNVNSWFSGKVALTLTGTPATQGSTGLSASATAGLAISNARSPDDYRGWFANVGGSGGSSVGGNVVAADLAVGAARDGYGVYVLDAGGGRGVVPPGWNKDFMLPVEFHGGATYTDVFDIDLAYVPLPFNPWAIFGAASGIAEFFR
jgi:hypothetical protein